MNNLRFKTKALVIALAVMAGAMASQAGEQANKTSAGAYVPQRGDYTFRTEVHATPDDEGCPISDIIITHYTDALGRTDTLMSSALPLDTTMWRGMGDILERDLNFDGVADLEICLGPMNAQGNFVYDGFLWDQNGHKFVRIENYSDIFNPEPVENVNGVRQGISGWFELDGEEETTTHEWRDGKLVPVFKKTETADNEF